MGMFFKPSLLPLLVLLLVFSFTTTKRPRFAEARPLSSPPQQRLSKMLGTLGLVCKCCDGPGEECKTTWVEPCSKLQCLPWKAMSKHANKI
ncbi:unnamed protein product [Camellia sinensis]